MCLIFFCLLHNTRIFISELMLRLATWLIRNWKRRWKNLGGDVVIFLEYTGDYLYLYAILLIVFAQFSIFSFLWRLYLIVSLLLSLWEHFGFRDQYWKECEWCSSGNSILSTLLSFLYIHVGKLFIHSQEEPFCVSEFLLFSDFFCV